MWSSRLSFIFFKERANWFFSWLFFFWVEKLFKILNCFLYWVKISSYSFRYKFHYVIRKIKIQFLATNLIQPSTSSSQSHLYKNNSSALAVKLNQADKKVQRTLHAKIKLVKNPYIHLLNWMSALPFPY